MELAGCLGNTSVALATLDERVGEIETLIEQLHGTSAPRRYESEKPSVASSIESESGVTDDPNEPVTMRDKRKVLAELQAQVEEDVE